MINAYVLISHANIVKLSLALFNYKIISLFISFKEIEVQK